MFNSSRWKKRSHGAKLHFIRQRLKQSLREVLRYRPEREGVQRIAQMQFKENLTPGSFHDPLRKEPDFEEEGVHWAARGK